MSGRVNRKKEVSHGPYKICLELKRHDEEPTVSVVSVDVRVAATGETVGYLKGYFLKRPQRSFHSTADAISGELQELAVLFVCESNGVASRIKHPKLVESPAVDSGGVFNIEKVEVRG
jgi:hypothetical protein